MEVKPPQLSLLPEWRSTPDACLRCILTVALHLAPSLLRQAIHGGPRSSICRFAPAFEPVRVFSPSFAVDGRPERVQWRLQMRKNINLQPMSCVVLGILLRRASRGSLARLSPPLFRPPCLGAPRAEMVGRREMAATGERIWREERVVPSLPVPPGGCGPAIGRGQLRATSGHVQVLGLRSPPVSRQHCASLVWHKTPRPGDFLRQERAKTL